MGRVRVPVRAVSSVVCALVIGVAAVLVTTDPAGAVTTSEARVTTALAAPHVYAGGGVLGFGAPTVGAPLTTPLNSVVVAQAADPVAPLSDEGYWLASADGGVFAVGDAGFYGSLGALRLTGPIVAMAATPDGRGYWLVAADGGIFTFGDARFFGSLGNLALNDPIDGMAPTPDDGGYYLVATDGGVFTEGDAVFRGSLGDGLGGNPHDILPVAGITLDQGGGGYWLLDPDGFAYSFANPPDPESSPVRSAIVAVAASQVDADPDTGFFCNPYGPCEEWCSLFATWVWEQAGVPIPSYPFTGNIYDWAAGNTGVLPPDDLPLPGDAVLYGTGPWSTATSVHVGVVVQVWPDGAIVTVEGDAGPAPSGSLAVIVNGPYLPLHSPQYNGVPVYAFAQP